jgi:opacity protein-like surface antigen
MEGSMKKSGLRWGAPLVGLALLTGVSAASAQEEKEVSAPTRGFYVGGTVGASIWDVGSNSDSFAAGFRPATSVSDGGDLTWGIFGGYRAADWLAVEVGYTDLGGFDAENTATVTNEARGEVSVDGIEARFRLWRSFFTPEFALTGGAGIFVYDSDDSVRCSNAGAPLACGPGATILNNTDDSGEALTLALGAQYRVHENVVLRAEWQRYFGVLNSDVDTVLVSVIVGFYDFFSQLGGGDDFGGVAFD